MDRVQGRGWFLGGELWGHPSVPKHRCSSCPKGVDGGVGGGSQPLGWVWGGGWLPPPSLTPFLAQAKGRQKRVKAVADCKGDKARELTFSKGEVIVVTREEDEQSWVSPPRGTAPPPSPPAHFGGPQMGTPHPVCAGGGHPRLLVPPHKGSWPLVPAFLPLAPDPGTPPHPLTPLFAPPGRLHRGRRLPHRCLPRQLRPPLARLTGSPPGCPFCPRPLGAGGARGGLGAGAGPPPGPSLPSPLSTGPWVLQPLVWGRVAAALPGDVGTPRLGPSPPGWWLWGAQGLPPPPAAITCTLRGGFGAPSPSFCGLCPSWGLSPPLSAGIWGWGGRAGCPPPSSAGWAQSPCARSPGGGCDAPPGFLLYHNCEALGIGREQKKGFLFIILGGLEGLRPHPAPLPRALRAPPGQRGLEMPQNSPSLGPLLFGCLGSARAAPWSRVPMSPCPSPGGCWSPPGPGGGSWGHPAAPFWDQRCPVSASLGSRRPLWVILVRVSASGLVCLFLMFSLSNF